MARSSYRCSMSWSTCCKCKQRWRLVWLTCNSRSKLTEIEQDYMQQQTKKFSINMLYV